MKETKEKKKTNGKTFLVHGLEDLILKCPYYST
jgi:hypothetical protein